MLKKFLVFNSSQEKNQELFGIFAELKKKNFCFSAAKLCFMTGLNNKFKQILFIIFLPFLFFIYFVYLAVYKIKKINAIICLNIGEKIIITPIAKLLKIKIIWVEDIDSIVLKNNIIKPISWFYKFFAKRAVIITFSGFIKNKLEQKKFVKENIRLIHPGIKLNNRERQENLFNELAQAGNRGYKRKFFTVGAAVDLNKKQKIENLLGAIKICQTVIPGIQLIVVGEGEERKNLSWISKKMELANITWFVGEQPHFKKWLDNFDIFVVSCETPMLDDIMTIIKAMAAGLPVIGPRDFGLEEIITEEECLFDENNSETTAKQIIAIWHDKRKGLKLGKLGQERVVKYFTADRMVEELEKIL
jgi:glycosyltransferase involved in cell wall biosynthesis